MGKAVLVMDMPESCEKCPMLNGADECILQDEDANFAADTLEDLKEGCPLVELPEKKENLKKLLLEAKHEWEMKTFKELKDVGDKIDYVSNYLIEHGVATR